MNYKMILQYEGTRYDGWQRQGNTDRTIQGKIEAVLTKMAGEPVEIAGSGRTDAGVHARGQVANFHLKTARKPDEILTYLNHYLPEDIRVLFLENVSERFHSRLNAASKTYRYVVWTGEKPDVFERRYCYGLCKKLDLGKMEEASKLLLGTHDFRSFCGNRHMKKSTVRTVESIHFLKLCGGEAIAMDFTGNGFLQQMVRILAGTLMEVGLGKRSPESVADALESLDRAQAGFTAPAQGLCLMEVRYEDGV